MILATIATLDRIKHSLEQYVGRKVLLKANKGRKQVVTRRGVLDDLYPSVFVIKVPKGEGEEGYRKIAYSYSDLLTENVSIKVFTDSSKQ